MVDNYIVGEKYRVTYNQIYPADFKCIGGKELFFQRLDDNTFLTITEMLKGATDVIPIADSDD